MSVSIEIRGLDKMLKKLDKSLVGEPLRTFFKRAAITVQGEARTRAPVDTGHLRNSIVYEVDSGALPLFAKIGPLKGKEGSPLWYKARGMEYGTGRVGQPGVAHRSGHWPPAMALDVWARRHGFASGGQVARIIGRRGGLKAHKYLQKGLEASLGQVKAHLSRLSDDIQKKWGKR